MPPAVAALNFGAGPCRGEACGGMLEAMRRIAPRRNGTILLDPSCRVKIPEKGSLNVDSKFFLKVQMDSKRGLG
jgi:hypothetical protein